MFQRTVRATVSLAMLATVFAAGCKRAPTVYAATPEKARDTLRQGLDAWKSGKNADAIRTSDSITFSDIDLEEGMKLLGYELQGDGAPDGFDWQCKVKLSLADTKGNKSEKRAIYNVNTSPKLVIVRKEM